VRRALAIAVLMAGCGGGNGPATPTLPPVAPAPTPTPVPTFSFRDGWTEQAVAAAATPATPTVGAVTAVEAPGYLVRRAVFNGSPFYLWPQDERYVRALVYQEGTRPLRRWTAGFTISPDGFNSLPAFQDAAAELSRGSGLPITVGPGGPVTVTIDPSDPYFQENRWLAYASYRHSADVIRSARVVFRSVQEFQQTILLHELGHVLGLSHSEDGRDVMAPYENRSLAFTEREKVALKLMYRWRQAGNALPDDMVPATTASAREETVVVPD
jgi:matrixin